MISRSNISIYNNLKMILVLLHLHKNILIKKN